MKTGRNHGGKKNVAHDRISSLPDEILTHILSFLSTKEAVHTCVLSKRWRMMWATVPVLDFNLCEFFMDDQNDAPGDYGRKSVVRFERFVDGVLDNQKSTNLDIVRYSCRSQRCEALVYMGWLDRVVLLMPQVILINFSRVFIFALNDPISCESLQHLVMDFCDMGRGTYNGIHPASIYLPSLKVLRLTGVYLAKDFAQKLFTGCPSLEKLYLRSCYLVFSSISSIKLKKLSIDACDQFEEMRISCPDLVSLLIDSCHPETVIGISLKDMTSLVNATVNYMGLGILVMVILCEC